MSPKTGRPPKDNPMTDRLQIRVNRDVIKKLDECATLQKTNRSEIVRQGIDLVYEKIKQ